MDRKELEIMAPAGSFDCLLAAIEGGADSVYFGIGHLNMRSHSANNFTKEDLPEVMRICREYGVKGYMTLNITLYDEDLQPAYDTLDSAKAAGVDAIIATDMAAIQYCRKIGLEVHISTPRASDSFRPPSTRSSVAAQLSSSPTASPPSLVPIVLPSSTMAASSSAAPTPNLWLSTAAMPNSWRCSLSKKINEK